MSATAPKVRGACENCHRRKIRCILPAGDNACQNCAMAGVSCLFAPRGKPGRVPARRNPDDDVRNSTPYLYEGVPQQQRQQQQLHASTSRPDPMALITPGDSPGFGLTFPNNDSDGSLNSAWARTDAMQGPDSESLPYFTQWPDMTQVGHLLSPQPSLHRIQMDDSQPSTAANTLADYSFLLGACKHMHDYCRPKPGSFVTIDHDLLGTTAKICAAAASGAQDMSTQTTGATAALVTATLLKVLELCDVVVSRLAKRSPMDPRPRIEELSTLKHLDLMLLQAKVSFTLEEQHAGVQKALELHRSIKALVDKDFGNWHWYD